MDLLTSKHTEKEAEKVIQYWYYGALISEAGAIILLCLAWTVRDWWYFAYGTVFLGITLMMHLMIQMLSIDLHLAKEEVD